MWLFFAYGLGCLGLWKHKVPGSKAGRTWGVTDLSNTHRRALQLEKCLQTATPSSSQHKQARKTSGKHQKISAKAAAPC